MSVEVILMADVADLGDQGSVVTVADGYARNYLLPKNLAAPVTDVTRKKLEKLRQEREEAMKAEIEAAHRLAAKFDNVSVTIPVKVGEEDKMFGSVTNADIAEAMLTQGFDIDRHALKLDEPIKELGVFDIVLKLHADVETTIKVWVVEE